MHGLADDLRDWLASQKLQKAFLCLDRDNAGEQGSVSLAEALNASGVVCRRVLLPVKDPAQFFLEHSSDAFRACLDQAEPIGKRELSAPTAEPGEALLTVGRWLYRAKTLNSSEMRFRAQVSMQEQDSQRSLSDTFDLRSRKSRVAFARAAHERWPEADEKAVEEHLEQLHHRLEVMQPTTEETGPAPVELTPAERQEAIEFLSRPDLVKLLLQDFEALGYVGEEEAKLLVYLVGISRMLDKPLSAIILSGSGAGKSFLAELAERLTPPEWVEFYSRLSPQALAFMPKDHLKRKLVILEERAGGEGADYSIRTLQSKQKIVQAVVIKDPNSGKMFTRRNEVEGPIAYIETTTNANINPENTSRCFEIPLDESKEQTALIQARQRRSRSLEHLETDSRTAEIERRHHLFQRSLETVKVVIPYAEPLTFSSRFLRNRRDNERFLSLLEAIAFIHQYQRPRKHYRSQEYIEATVDDYRLAYTLGARVLGTAIDELGRWSRELLEWLRSQPQPDSWSRRTLREALQWPDHRLRDSLQELVSLEYLSLLKGPTGNVFFYRLTPEAAAGTPVSLGLLSPLELERRMQNKAVP